METKTTLKNNTEFYLNNEEVFLRSIPTKLKVGSLTTDALRLLVYYVTKVSPFDLAVESGNFEGTLEQWLESLQSNLSFKATVDTYLELETLQGLSNGDLVFVVETGKVYPLSSDGFPSEDKGLSITGDSAYNLAKKAGFIGTEEEWLVSLKGTAGIDGAEGKDGITQEANTILLTGVSTETNSVILDTDTLLIALGKLQAQVTDLTARLSVLEVAE